MYLSKLVFLCVKNTIYLNDSSFNYEAFLDGDFNSDPDYDTNINNVFSPLNEALSRLSDLERIPYRVEEVKIDYTDKTIDLDQIEKREEDPRNIKEIHAVGQFIGGKPKFLPFKRFSNRVIILGYIDIRYPIYIEYKEDLPYFSSDDLVQLELEGQTVVDNNIDLKKYGLTDSMCNYAIEYVQGKLEEQIEPTLANMHVTRAESYFNNIRTVRPVFLQDSVARVYRIGE